MKKIKSLYGLVGIISAIIATINFVNDKTFILILVFWLGFAVVQLGVDKSEELLEVVKNKYKNV
jgi:hypothetical protein